MKASRRHARHVQIGQLAGTEITLSAPAIRSVSLSVCGFSVAHPPHEVKRDGYRRLAEFVGRGEIVVDSEVVELGGHRDRVGTPENGQEPTQAGSRSGIREEGSEMSEPIVLRGGTVLTMNDAHEVLHDADVLVIGDRIEKVGPNLEVPGEHENHRREQRHRDAGHDRHAPAHVADGAARLWRGLDAVAVLRLLLPRAREDLPPAGHPRGQRAVGDRVARRRRDHDRRLVARPADGRSRRRRGRRAPKHPRKVRPRLREHPAGPVGVGGVQGLQRLRAAALRHQRRHARLPDGIRRHRRSRVSPSRRHSRSRASSTRPSPRTRACGARPTTTASD